MRTITALVVLGFALAASAQRFVRFISTDNKEYYGDAILPAGTFDAAKSTKAKVVIGDILGDFRITNQIKVSDPRSASHVESDICYHIAHQKAVGTLAE